MPTIRSLLWIGSGRGLAASGVSEAPELDVTWVPDLAEATKLPRVPFDGALIDVPHTRGLAPLVVRVGELVGGMPVLVCLSDDRPETADEAISAGAAAVLFLDGEAPRPGFVETVSQALDAYHANEPEIALACPGEVPSAALVAQSAAMREVTGLVALAASSPSTVLLTGETGAGKEVVARQLHTESERAAEPFVPINCAAFPETLLESELFGHVKGAFTGADRTKPGLFEVAGRGTLFLDEIAEMELSLQAKLLRVLQEREIRPIGGTRARSRSAAGSSPPPIACSRRRCARDIFARTSSTASTSSRSASRRCASDARTSCPSRAISWRSTVRAKASATAISRSRRRSCSRATTGPATSASSRTRCCAS